MAGIQTIHLRFCDTNCARFVHYCGLIVNIFEIIFTNLSRNNVYISDPKISRVPSRPGLFPYVQTALGVHVRPSNVRYVVTIGTISIWYVYVTRIVFYYEHNTCDVTFVFAHMYTYHFLMVSNDFTTWRRALVLPMCTPYMQLSNNPKGFSPQCPKFYVHAIFLCWWI